MRLVLLLCAALLLVGCQDDPSANPSNGEKAVRMLIQDVDWQLTEVAGRPVGASASSQQPAQIRLLTQGNRVQGFSGVNQFNGSYTLMGETLRFGPTAMTRRAGPPELMQQESAFTRALEQTTTFRATEGTLDLIDSGGNTLATFTGTTEGQK